MSWNRQSWDECAYQHKLRETVGPADYILNMPKLDCDACFSPDPSVRLSSMPRISKGVSECQDVSWIDVDSTMKNINRKASQCPSNKHFPGNDQCSLGAVKDCAIAKNLPQEDTRLSNPPCTLRCSGWNRWEWLCRNPQEKALVAFDYNINNRLIVKDNHHPCVKYPITDQALPPLNGMSDEMPVNQCGSRTPYDEWTESTTWRSCKTYHGVQNKY